MRTDSRFDANKVVRLATLTGQRRFEMQFSDSHGKTHVVSLPLPDAVELACLICDASDSAPYLVGGIRRLASQEKS
jgi:hypothetical protein